MKPDLSTAPSAPLVLASILSADFARLLDECRDALDRGADGLHLDVMDGHFVPNLTMGPALCRSLRRALPDALLDVHLMVTDPGRFVRPFADAGADQFTFHLEPAAPTYRSESGAGGGPEGTGYDIRDLARRVRDAGMSAGVAINPDTSADALIPHLDDFDLILIMSVFPGFSGQSFIESSLESARAISTRLEGHQRLEMDGGIHPGVADRVRSAGCDVVVAASAIFGRPADERGDVIARLRGGS